MSNETLGQRIRRLREQHGMSQAALARRLDASTNAINLLEQDRISDPHWQRMLAIAAIFEVSLDYLAGLTDDPTPAGRARRPRSAKEMAMLVAAAAEGR
jgi:transcriptional regulator with XRE-family HTH domain